MRSLERRPATVALIAAFVLAAAMSLPARFVLSRMAPGRPYDVAWVPRADAFRLASDSVRLSIAHYYWLSTVQYLGDDAARASGYEKLFPLVDLVTDLDPQHGYAYQTAGVILSAEGRLEESQRILQKGIEKGPNWWTFPMYIAFNHFFYLGDYAEAGRWAELAARTPGAPTSVSHLALAMKVKGGSPDDAIRFLQEMLATARDDTTRSALEEQYRLALLQRDFRMLDDAVERFRAARGRSPARLEELVAAGVMAAVPRADPFGGVYELRDGVVHATGRDHRFAPPEKGRLPIRGEMVRDAAPPQH